MTLQAKDGAGQGTASAGMTGMASWQGNGAPGTERASLAGNRSYRGLVLMSRPAPRSARIVTSREAPGE
jgi:hypothetical protein